MKSFKSLTLILLSLIFNFVSAQIPEVDSLYALAERENVVLLDDEIEILEKSEEIKNYLDSIQDYTINSSGSGQINLGNQFSGNLLGSDGNYYRLAITLSDEDYSIYEENLRILRKVNNELMPSLINKCENYLYQYWSIEDFSLEQINNIAERNIEYFEPFTVSLPREITDPGNLQPVSYPNGINLNNLQNTYKVTGEDVIPIRMNPVDYNLLVPVALFSMKLRIENPQEMQPIAINVSGFEVAARRTCSQKRATCRKKAHGTYVVTMVGCTAIGVGVGTLSFWCAGCAGVALGVSCGAGASAAYSADLTTCQDNYDDCINN